MFGKFMFCSILVSMISHSICLNTNFSGIDSICEYCLSFEFTNNFIESECLKYKALCDLKNMVEYIGDRLMTAKKVAVAKWDTNDSIVDPIREEQILNSIANQSDEMGLDSVWAKMFFRTQMDANIFVQQKLHEDWNRLGSRPHGPPVDLVTDIRPIIDKLNSALIYVSFNTRLLRGTNVCHFLRDISAQKVVRTLSMDSIHRQAFKMALVKVCLEKEY